MSKYPNMAKQQSSLVKAYLILYNVILTAGWAYVSYLGYQKRDDYTKIWSHTEIPLKIVQTAAVMEIFHAMVGITPTSVFLVGFQVFSRLGVVWGILDLIPPSRVSVGVPLLFICWNVTEIIRYSYYALHLIGYASIIQWFRYSLFVILYPLGITGELWAAYDSLAYIKKHKVWSYQLPNALNATFDYHAVVVILMLMYIPVFPQLYFHMFAQRRKILGGVTSKKSN